MRGRRRRTGGQQRLRAARWAQICELRNPLAQIAAGLIAYNVLALVVWPHRPAATFTAGALDGSVGMLIVWLINTRTYNLTMGAWAEAWTSELLRKQTSWRVVDGLPMDGYDIDHIAFTPSEVFAVESKYYGPSGIGPRDRTDSRLDKDIATAKRRARSAALLLGSPAVGLPSNVTAMLVLWGVGTPPHLITAWRSGVWVVRGNEPGPFIENFTSQTPSERASVVSAAAGLEAWARTAGDRDQVTERPSRLNPPAEPVHVPPARQTCSIPSDPSSAPNASPKGALNSASSRGPVSGG